MTKLRLIALVALLTCLCHAQPPRTLIYEWGPKKNSPPPHTIRGTELTPSQWRELVDKTWGSAKDSRAEKWRLFDVFWTTIDRQFAAFPGLELDWNTVRERYRPEIEKGVSVGRLAAILDHTALALRDGGHTWVHCAPVHLDTAPNSGVPLLLVGWRDHARFGAALTPLPDGRLLVYSAHAGNPLDLEPGDIVLGYEGKPWSDIYPRLIDAQLPIVGKWPAAPSAYAHMWLASAGLNWHLFETIDVLKFKTKQVVHLPTKPLNEQSSRELFASEQIPVAGVPHRTLKEIYDGDNVAWGRIDGDIGYIYLWRWTGKTDKLFYEAVDSLLKGTSGLIIDFRANLGGNMFLSNPALSLLFRGETRTIGFLKRRTGTGHNDFEQATGEDTYIIRGAGGGYNRPIAVLTGPGAVSSGDQVALRMKFHPKAKIFGKPTNGAFSAAGEVDFKHPDWSGRFSQADCYLASDPSQHLTRRELPVDFPVWLTPDDVAQGRDTVVEAAIKWIRGK